MRKSIISIGASALIWTMWMRASLVRGQLRDYWELVDTKTSEILGDYEAMEEMSNDLSQLPMYDRLILDGLGCASQSSAGRRAKDVPNQKRSGAYSAPCKIQNLYIDPAADGTPSGRALAAHLMKSLQRGGVLKLVSDRKDANAIFACRDELNEMAASHTRARLAADASSGTPLTFISYIVESGCDDKGADLTYSPGNGESEQDTVAAPWATLVFYSPRTNYYVAAQKHDGSECDISVGIYQLSLTMDQADDLRALPGRDETSYIRDHGTQLREASSDTGYGIAEVSWAGQDRN